MNKNKIVSKELCNCAIDALAEEGFNFDDNTWRSLKDYFEENFESYEGKTLPAYNNLVNLIKQNKNMQKSYDLLARTFANQLYEDFEIIAEQQKELDEEQFEYEQERQAKIKSQKELLKQFNQSQIDLIGKHFNILAS